MPPDTDIILFQTPCAIVYQSADWGPPIPYGHQIRPETPDRPNRGFIDFRDKPLKASAVFEAGDVPGLRRILFEVNDLGSNFMSLGCERNLNVLHPPVGEANCYLNSYCEITYRKPEQQTENNLIDFAIALSLEANLHPTNWCKLELGIEEMKHFFGQPNLYCLNIAVSGYGRNSTEAYASHKFGGERIADALKMLVRKHPL